MNQPTINDRTYEPTLGVNRRVLERLAAETRPMTAAELTAALGLRYDDVHNALTTLIVLGRVIDLRPAGYCIADTGGHNMNTNPNLKGERP